MNILDTGNVGIGTSSPSSILEVSSSNPVFRITDTREVSTIGADIGTIEFYSEDQSGNYPAVGAAIKAINLSSFGSGTGLTFHTNADTVSPTERMRIDSSGNVGIGTPTPLNRLSVKSAGLNTIVSGTIASDGSYLSYIKEGSTGIPEFHIANAGGSTTTKILGSGISYFNGGNVGIGTTGPAAKLQISQAQNTASAFTDPFLKLLPSSITNTTGLTSIALGTSVTNGYGVSLNAWRFGTGGSPKFSIKMHDGSMAGQDALIVDKDGNVGIGTTSTDAKLDVRGDVRVTGAYYDSLNSPGTSGQVLSSTVTGTDWVDGLPSFLEHNNTDQTFWNNGSGNFDTNTSFGEYALKSTTSYLNIQDQSSISGYMDGTYTNVQTSYVSGTLPTTLPTVDIEIMWDWPNISNLLGGVGVSSDTILTVDKSLLGGVGSGVVEFGFWEVKGDNNTAIGNNALSSTTTGIRNVATGVLSLYSNTTGFQNTAIGYHSLRYSTTGRYNTANGAQALYKNTTGYHNAAVGLQSLYNNTTGRYNTSQGSLSLYNTSTGAYNTANGAQALYSTSTGAYNTANGAQALYRNATGSYNTACGYKADVISTNLTNTTAIGYNAIANASNKVRLGNTSVTVIEGQVGFTAASDARIKTNIQSIDKGIDFVMQLKPVSYLMKESADKRINWGFIAQDVESLVGVDNAVLTVGEDDERSLGLRYTDFISPIVKAMQEQQKLIEDLRLEIELLKNK
jgi:hypothetical protein